MMDAMGPIYHQSRPASVFSYIFAATFSLFQLQLLMLETQSCGLDYSHKLIYQESKNLAELFSQTLRGMLAGSFHQDDMKHHIFFGLGDPKLNLHVPRFTVILGGVKGASPTSFSYGVMVCVCVCVFFLWTCQNKDILDLFLSKLLDIFSQFETKPTSYV